jgi:hypothetical protein
MFTLHPIHKRKVTKGSIVISTPRVGGSPSHDRASRRGAGHEAWSEEVHQAIQADGDVELFGRGAAVGGLTIGVRSELPSIETEDWEAQEAANPIRACVGSNSLQCSQDLATNAECSRFEQIRGAVGQWIDSVQLSHQILGGNRPPPLGSSRQQTDRRCLDSSDRHSSASRSLQWLDLLKILEVWDKGSQKHQD